MAGYDEGVFEDRPVTTPDRGEEERRRRQDRNAGWNATSGTTDGTALVDDQFQFDVDRYRGLGDAATRQGPVTLGTRPNGFQTGALDLLRRQADGRAASSAETLSQRANENAGRAAATSTTGARGVGAALGGFNAANAGAAGQAMAANAQSANARAGEISHGQNAFTSGAGAVRQGDIAIATQNAQLDAQNRALAEKQQQFYERMAFDTRNTEMTAANEVAGGEIRKQQQLRAARQAENAADFQKAKDVASIGGSTFSSIAAAAGDNKKTDSDPRAKTHIGSLSSLRKRY